MAYAVFLSNVKLISGKVIKNERTGFLAEDWPGQTHVEFLDGSQQNIASCCSCCKILQSRFSFMCCEIVAKLMGITFSYFILFLSVPCVSTYVGIGLLAVKGARDNSSSESYFVFIELYQF